jgi:hypothetical protein
MSSKKLCAETSSGAFVANDAVL